MEQATVRPPPYTLRRVAFIVVALVCLLPLLLFVYTLYFLGGFAQPHVQLTFALALGSELVGLYIFWVMLARMSELLRTATAAAPTAAEAPSGETPAPASPASGAAFEIPGMGRVSAAHAFVEPIDELGAMWRAEAEPHVGHRVLVSVMNSPEPVAGTLMQVTKDGLLLEQDGRRLGITYRRISAVELDRQRPDRSPAG